MQTNTFVIFFCLFSDEKTNREFRHVVLMI